MKLNKPVFASTKELYVWKDARNLIKEVYYQSQRIDNMRYNDYMRRTALAVLCGIAEGYSSGSREEFRSFMHKSSSCCKEIRNMLYIAKYRNYLDGDSIARMMDGERGLQEGLCRLIRRGEKRNPGNKV